MPGIKESMDLVNLLKVSGEVYAAAKADGSIDYKDLTKLGPELAALREAANGAELIPSELKDLDQAELSVLCPELIGAIIGFVKAVMS